MHIVVVKNALELIYGSIQFSSLCGNVNLGLKHCCDIVARVYTH